MIVSSVYLTCMPLYPVTPLPSCCKANAVWHMQGVPYVCLVRATDGKKKISTTVGSAMVPAMPDVLRTQY